MKKTVPRMFAAIFYIFSVFLLFLALHCSLGGSHPFERMFLLCLGCAGIYGASRLIGRTISKLSAKRLIHLSLYFFFVIYLLFILSLTLLDRLQGRNVERLFWRNAGDFVQYLNTSCNFIPLHSIIGYFSDFFNGRSSLRVLLINFLGNIVAFMPLAFFLPLLFPKISQRKRFLCCIAIFVAAIELLQMVFNLGEGDIDDWILNVGGAWILFELLRLPFVRSTIQKFIYPNYSS